MLHSVLSPIAPVSVSFGERRSAHSTFSRPFSLGIDLMTGHSQPSNRPPYPSPPMSGSPPPDTFPTHRHELEQSLRQSHQQDGHEHHEHRRHSYHPQTPISSVAAGESRLSQPAQNTIPSPIGRSPFTTQTPSALPQTQRKTKTHVASACVNCKKAHLACDVIRPCPRCVGLNKQDTCRDVQHKKRGRPRLRDERTHSFEVNQMASMTTHPDAASPLSSPTANSTYRPPTHRVLKASSDSHSRMSRGFNSYAVRSPQTSQLARYFDDPPAPISYTISQMELKAFLTDELVIAWSTDGLRDFLGYQERELNGVKSLFDIVSPDDRERVYRLYRQIRDEMQFRDPFYRSPPFESVYNAIRSTHVAEVSKAASSSRIHEEVLDVKHLNGRRFRTTIRIQVVKISVFFMVAEFLSVTEVQQPPQYPSMPSHRYGPPSPYGQGSYSSVPPMASPPPPGYAPEAVSLSQQPQQPYSLYPNRGLPSPIDSRPRSLHADSMYPSLAPYANANPSTGSLPHSHIASSPNTMLSSTILRRHSDQPVVSSSLKLPPLRSPEGLPGRQVSNIQPLLNETDRKPKRIAVEDVLQ